MRLISVFSLLLLFTNSAFGCGATLSPNQKLCFDQGNSYNVTFTGTGGTAPYTFSYTVNNGATQTIVSDLSGVATLTVTMIAQGNYDYLITNVTDDAGCTQALNVTSYVFLQGTITAFISGTATVNQNFTPGPVITFNCNGGAPPIIFSYTINGGPVQTITSNNQGMAFLNAPTNTIGTFVYELVDVTSSLSCVGIPNITNSTVTITVQAAPPNPTGTVSISGQCDHYTLTFQGSGGSTSSYTYTYTLNGVTYNQNGGANFSMNGPSVSSVTNYTLSGVSVTNNGSTGTLSGGASVTIGPNVWYSVYTNNASVCLNGTSPTVTFTKYNAPPGNVTFSYKINGGATQMLTGAGNSASLSVPTNTAGTFVYAIQAPYEMCLTIGPPIGTTVVVKPLPTAAISGSATVCAGSTNPNITFTGANGTGPYTFTYKLNGGADQTISTTGSNTSVTLPVSTSIAGTFTYSLVSVSSSAGCSQNQTGTATIVVNAVPSATISGNTSVCQNANSSAVTFTGSGSVQPYTFTYSINGGANQTLSSGSSNNAIINQSNATAGTSNYQLVSVTSGNGCVSNVTGTVSVEIKELPQAVISGSAVVCQNSGLQQVQFSSPGSNSPYTYAYKLNGGAVQTISSGASSSVALDVSSANAGTFTYELLNVTAANGCSQSQMGSALFVVNSLPTVSISGNTTVCQNAGQPAVVLNTSTSNGPFDIVFNVNGGSNQTINSGANTTVLLDAPTTNAGTLVYNLVSITDSHGCSQAQSGTATIIVNSLPSASITGNTTVCMNDVEPTVELNGVNGNGSYSFVFNLNGGTNQTINSNGTASVLLDVPTNTSGSFVYNLVSVSDANGCTQNQTGSATIMVNSLPGASLAGGGTVCQNDQAPEVLFDITGDNAPFHIVYTIDGENQMDEVYFSMLFNVPTSIAGEFEYGLISITDANGCSQNYSSSVSVTVNPTPVAPTIQASEAGAICDGQSITLTSSATDNLWSTGETSQSIVVTNEGDYFVEQVVLGCSSEASTVFALEVIEIVIPDFQLTTEYCQNSAIGALPTISLNGVEGEWSPQINNTQTTAYTFTPNSGSCAEEVIQTITINALPDVGLSSISDQCVYSPQFTLNQGTPAGGTYQVNGVTMTAFDPSEYQQGTYQVVYTFADNNGCTNEANNSIVVDECLGLTETENVEIVVYPNPSNGVFNFSVSNKDQYTISVFDRFGKVVYNGELNSASSTIDLSILADGVYTIRVANESGFWNKIIVKQ